MPTNTMTKQPYTIKYNFWVFIDIQTERPGLMIIKLVKTQDL